MIRRFSFWMILPVLGCLCALPARSADPADSNELPWGSARAGMQLALQPGGQTPWDIHVSLRNAGSVDIPMPDATDVFGWLIIQQGTQRYFSARLPRKKSFPLPEELAVDAMVTWSRDVSDVQLYPYRRGVRFIDSFARNEAPEIEPAGSLQTVLQPGEAKVMFCLYLTPPGSAARMLASQPMPWTVPPPDFEELDDTQRRAFLAGLLQRFDRDAWSAKSACASAVRVGPAVLDTLIPAAQDRDRPMHSRLWLAAAVASIPDPRAVKASVTLLDDPAVRTVVAYYGPKQQSRDLNHAIVTKAETLNSGSFTAYALLGALTFGRSVPPNLLTAGLDSEDPRARSAAAEALRNAGGGAETLRALVGLLEDETPAVRATAARVLGHVGEASPAVLGALVEALGKEGDLPRMRICAALSKLTGRAGEYDPSAGSEQKAAVLAGWQRWWQQQRPQTAPNPSE